MMEDTPKRGRPKKQPEIIPYKGKTFAVSFEIMNVPKLQEIKNFTQGGYYLTNRDRPTNDTWFAQLLELYYTSPLHGAILNKLHNKINAGLNDLLFNEISLDFCLFGGFAVEILWNYYHTKIVEIKALPFDKVRAGLVDKKTKKIEYYLYSNDFFKVSYRNWYKLDVFNTDKDSSPHQIFYFKDGRQHDIYPKPYYNAALKYIYVQNELSTYYAALIKNGFVSNGILHLPNPLSEEQERMEENLFLRDNTGSRNAGGIIITHGRQDEAPTFTPFNEEQADGRYTFLPEYTDTQIVMGHQVPVQLMIQTPGKLGGTDDYKFYSDLYNTEVVDVFRNKIMIPYNMLKGLMVNNQTEITPINKIEDINKNKNQTI